MVFKISATGDVWANLIDGKTNTIITEVRDKYNTGEFKNQLNDEITSDEHVSTLIDNYDNEPQDLQLQLDAENWFILEKFNTTTNTRIGDDIVLDTGTYEEALTLVSNIIKEDREKRNQ